MDLKYFKNEGDGIFSILLHGIIGEEVNGAEIASEILLLNNLGAKVIRERINTIGGSVIDGFSIVSANLASRAEIHTFNEGVADSTGSWILASGTPGKRGSFDFASAYFHNPTYQGKPIEEIDDEGLRKELQIMTDSIVTILANNSNKSKKEIKELMSRCERMTANEAKDFGVIDFVENSKNKPALKENMSMADIMNICHDFNNQSTEDKNTNNKPIKMKRVAKFFNLSEEATEESILAEVQKLKEKSTAAVSNLNTAKEASGKKDTEITNLKADVKKLKDEAEAHVDLAIGTAVDAAIKSGKYEEKDKEDVIGIAKGMGIENFNKLMEKQKAAHVNVIDNLNSDSGKKPVTDKEKEKEITLAKEFQDMSENDPAGLAKLEVTDKKKFDDMYAASIKHDVTVKEDK